MCGSHLLASKLDKADKRKPKSVKEESDDDEDEDEDLYGNVGQKRKGKEEDRSPKEEGKPEKGKGGGGPRRKKTFDIESALNKAERKLSNKWSKLKGTMEDLSSAMGKTIHLKNAMAFVTEKELVCLRLSWLQAVMLESPNQLTTLKARCVSFSMCLSVAAVLGFPAQSVCHHPRFLRTKVHLKAKVHGQKHFSIRGTCDACSLIQRKRAFSSVQAAVNGGASHRKEIESGDGEVAGSSRDSRVMGSEGAAPCDQWESLSTLHDLLSLKTKLRSTDAEEGITEIFSSWESKKSPLLSLVASCKTAHKDLESAIAGAARAAQKEKERLEKERERHASKTETSMKVTSLQEEVQEPRAHPLF